MKNTIAAILLAAIAATAYGRDNENEISFEVSGGLSSISYSSEFGSQKPMAGTSVGINYLRNFNSNWGLGTGVSFRLYQSRTSFGAYSDSCVAYINVPAGATGADIDRFRLDYTYIDLEETQKAFYISIPVFAQYRHDCGFYARLGAQVNIPVGGRSEITYGSLKTSGYFPYDNVTFTNMPSHGFGLYLDGSAEEDISYRVNGSLYAEVGWNWDWNDKNILYVGIAGEYGLGKVYKQKNPTSQLLYNDGNFGYTPIWNANIIDSGVEHEDIIDYNSDRKSVTDGKNNNYSVGIVLRYSFGW